MFACPDYRLRIYLSVDLVGSTAFKTNHGTAREKNQIYPNWVHQTKEFYKEFPKTFKERYAAQIAALSLDQHEICPQVWKTIGDEIVFCGRVFTLEHFTACVIGFLKALHDYGGFLEVNCKHLDVKGSVWVAGFPAPNVSVRIFTDASSTEKELGTTEEEEACADEDPHTFDFLGQDIDTGFRITRHSASSHLAMSCEAAFLLAEAANESLHSATFIYNGRETLKGVMGGKPYPVINIDTERSREKREVIKIEMALSNKKHADAADVSRFLKALLDQEKIECPILLRKKNAVPVVPSRSYGDFQSAWNLNLEEIQKRKKSEDDSATREESAAQSEIDVIITDSFDDLVSSNDADSKNLV